MIKVDLHKKLKAKPQTFNLEVKFEVEPGSFVAVYGNSGAGKTSLLRLMAGLDKPDKGSVFIDNTCWSASSTKQFIKPQNRNIGFVFQDYALFPNMTVLQNLQYALAPDQDKSRKPKVLFLDEPLSSLDSSLRLKLQKYLIQIHKEFNLTIFMVSHDLSEIFNLADQVIKLDQGKVVEIDTPNEIFKIEHDQDSWMQLTGTILTIDTMNSTAKIASSNTILKLNLTQKDLENIQIGDHVVLKHSNNSYAIEKITME